MADLAVTYSFQANTTASASQVNQDFSDIVTYINNRTNALATWDNVNVTATTATPVTIKSSASTTEVAIDNTATDGDPQLTFKLSGSLLYAMGVDDSDSDILKFGTTGITSNVAMQIPTAGSQVQFASGSAATPSISIIGAATDGLYSAGAGQVAVSCAGTFVAQFVNTGGNIRFHLPNGSASVGAAVFDSDQDTGFYRVGANAAALSAGGGAIAAWRSDISPSGFEPGADNSINLGRGSVRWKEVFAVAGTINTSHSLTKSNIKEIDLNSYSIPKGVEFERDGRKYVGYLNDDLPDIARPLEEGKILKTQNYESAVVGILCAAVRKLQSEIKEIHERRN